MFIFLLIQVLSGFLVALGQPSLCSYLGPLSSCIGFAVYWRTLDFLPSSFSRKSSFLWFFFIQLFQLSWMTKVEYQGSVFLLVYLAFAVGLAFQFVFLTERIRKDLVLNFFSVISLASFWVLFEWGRLFFLCGFAFNFVGLSLTCFVWPLQMASLFGVLGLSFWVVLTNLFALKFLRDKRSYLFLLQWGVVSLIPYAYGAVAVLYHDYRKGVEKEGNYAICLVQTGLSPAQKYRLPKREVEFISPLEQWRSVLSDLSVGMPDKVDLIVFPEAVFPYGFSQRIYNKEDVDKELIRFFGPSIEKSFPVEDLDRVSNAYWFQALSCFFRAEVVAGLDVLDGERNYNSAFFFNPDGSFPRRYDKRVLLPLAEYMPFSFLKGISRVYGIDEFFTKGLRSEVIGSCFVSPSICYEELFPSLVREGRMRGAKLFVNITNDGWYPQSSLPEQHFVHGLIRAVENGVPLVRSCNTGVTGAVDSLGRVVARLGSKGDDFQKMSGVLILNLSKYQHKTLFLFLGEAPFVCLCFLFSFLPFFKIAIMEKERGWQKIF